MTHVARIRLIDFMAFAGEHDVDLPAGAVLVTGPNYVGKSSLLESVGWCLYGHARSRFRSRDAVIHGDARRAVVELVLSDGTTITRTRTRGSADLVDVAPEGNIETRLGIDAEGYGRLCHLDQGASLALAHATEAHRREVVLGWIGEVSRRWDQAGTRVRARVVELRSRLDQARGAIEQAREAGEPMTPDARAQLEREIADAEAELERARRAVLARRQREHVVEAARRLKAATDALATHPADAVLDLDAVTAEEQAAIEADATARRQAEALGRLVRHGFDGACPVTAQACPAAAHVRQQQDAIAARAAEAAGVATETAARRDAVTRERAERARTRTQHETVRREYEVARRAFLEARERLAELEHDLDWQGDSDMLAELIRAGRDELARDDARIRASEQLVRLEEGAARLETELAGALLLARAFSAVPGPVAHAVAQVEQVAAALLDGTGLTTRVAWRRDTARLVPGCYCGYVFSGRQRECALCGTERAREQVPAFDILVDDGDGEDEIRHKSGAAKALATTALRLAAGAACPGLGVGWRILDEGFGELDAERARALARMVERAPSVGVSQVLLVSHDPVMQSAFERRVVIERVGNGRRVVVT